MRIDRRARFGQIGPRRTHVLLALVSTLVSLVALEWALRLVLPVPQRAGTTDPLIAPNAAIYGWGYPPSTSYNIVDPDTRQLLPFHVNSRGWKDRERILHKPIATARVVVIGDSVTFGIVALEEQFTTRLERKLRDAGYDAEVIAIAGMGWGTDQEYEALLKEGLLYSPDIVISQFTTNDLTDNLLAADVSRDDLLSNKPFRFILEEGGLKRLDVGRRVDSELGQLLRQSLLLTYAGKFLRRVTDSSGRTITDTLSFETELYSENGLTSEWQLYEALVRAMKSASDSSGALFALFSESGEEGQRQWLLRHQHVSSDVSGGDYAMRSGTRIQIDTQTPLRTIERIAGKVDALFVPNHRAYSRFRNDPHPNQHGNEMMADDIYDFLRENSLTNAILQGHRTR